MQETLPIEENAVYQLFRRGKPEHINNLLKKGEIYINTVDYMRTCDFAHKDRCDPNDSMLYRQFLFNAKITICDMDLDIEKDGTTFHSDTCEVNYDDGEKGNIYCLSGIFTNDLLSGEEETIIDTRSFGESLIVIFNPRKFIERIQVALAKEGYKRVQCGQVRYYKREHCGKTGVFKKNEYYSYQKEFRFYIPNTENKEIKINIGSIEDIAKIMDGIYLRYNFSNGNAKVFRIPQTIL